MGETTALPSLDFGLTGVSNLSARFENLNFFFAFFSEPIKKSCYGIQIIYNKKESKNTAKPISEVFLSLVAGSSASDAVGVVVELLISLC